MPTPAELDLRPSSCACEMVWLAAYIPLLAKWLRAMEDGDRDRATAACHKLKRQVGRMLIHYERGPSVIRVPLLALQAAMESMTESARFQVSTHRRGAKFNLVKLQRTLRQSLRAFERISFFKFDPAARDATTPRSDRRNTRPSGCSVRHCGRRRQAVAQALDI